MPKYNRHKIFSSLVCPSDISTGNYLTRIAGRLAHEIIFSGMNYDRFTDNFVKGKSAIEEGSPCIAEADLRHGKDEEGYQDYNEYLRWQSQIHSPENCECA